MFRFETGVVPAILLLLLVFPGFSLPALCQSPLPEGKTSDNRDKGKLSKLNLLRHDPKRQGPLLFVAQDKSQFEYDAKDEISVRQGVEGRTAAQFAPQIIRRVLTVGDITTFIPATMKEIVQNPGKPDPYAGMRFDQRFALVLASLTRDQWKLATSANGIGFRDLNEEQRSLFAGLWKGESVTLQTVRTPTTDIASFSVLESSSLPLSDVRFRLSRHVSLHLKAMGKGTMYGYQPGRDDEDAVGERQADGSRLRQELRRPDDFPDANDHETVTAFGVPIIRTVPNRLKTGQLPLDAPALNVGMHLDGSQKTLGQLLAAVSDATRLRLVADKRVAFLPVVYKLAPGGQVVSTGDVLKVLCRSVTGTFRRLDGPNGKTVYLLTDDVEGIGTRFARLDRWAEKPSRQRTQAYQKALESCAENEPLDLLGFPPDYPNALPAEQVKKIDDLYRAQGTTRRLTVPVRQLSPALREEFRRGVKSWREWLPNVTMQSDEVGLDTNFHCDWILPGGRIVPEPSTGILNSSFLRQVAVPRAERKETPLQYRNSVPTPLPAAVKRRILVTSLPKTEEDIRRLFALSSGKGFTETWLRVEDSTQTTREQLQVVMAHGSKAKVRVGVVIPWLLKEDADVPATRDVNILAETGAGWVENKVQDVANKNEAKQLQSYYEDRVAGWVVPESQNVDDVVRRVSPFLRITNLSAVVFANSAPPGYEGFGGEQGDSNSITELMGYNTTTRFRCVVEKGFDPVDVAAPSYRLDVSPGLPFFQPTGLATSLAEFRLAQNRSHLARIYIALRASFPQIPFYMDNRYDGYSAFTFYGHWAKPDGLPELRGRYVTDIGRLRSAAFANTPAPIFEVRGMRTDFNSLFSEGFFWSQWHDGTAEAIKGWGGIALNMGTESLADVAALLDKLPDGTTPTR